MEGTISYRDTNPGGHRNGHGDVQHDVRDDAYGDVYYDVVDSELGAIFVGGSSAGVHRIDFLDGPGSEARSLALLEAQIEAQTGESAARAARDAVAAAPAVAQLREYFAGQRQSFDLPLAPIGTRFQRLVWEALRAIGYGETATYGEVAREIGRPTASRAVGAANGRNPLPIVVPCHRVIGAGGALTGYAGGLDRKAWLLNHEAAALR